jgi:hypothetical protein
VDSLRKGIRGVGSINRPLHRTSIVFTHQRLRRQFQDGGKTGKTRVNSTKRFMGHRKSADVIRTQPANSIRARDTVSHTEAECMAAISTCNVGTGKMLGKNGRRCMKRDTQHRLAAME